MGGVIGGATSSAYVPPIITAMEDSWTLESWHDFFSLIYSAVSEIRRKREAESLAAVDSIHTKLHCCIDSIVTLKDHIELARRTYHFEEGEVEAIEDVLMVLDNMISKLYEEESYWSEKVTTLQYDEGIHVNTGVTPADSFVQCHRHTGLPGRPKFHLDSDQIESLQAMGFSFVAISKMFGISRATLYRRCAELGILHRRMTQVSDVELVDRVTKLKEVLPHVGERVIIGHLRQAGIYVQRERVRRAIHHVDPLNTARLYDGISTSLDAHTQFLVQIHFGILVSVYALSNSNNLYVQ